MEWKIAAMAVVALLTGCTVEGKLADDGPWLQSCTDMQYGDTFEVRRDRVTDIKGNPAAGTFSMVVTDEKGFRRVITDKTDGRFKCRVIQQRA